VRVCLRRGAVTLASREQRRALPWCWRSSVEPGAAGRRIRHLPTEGARRATVWPCAARGGLPDAGPRQRLLGGRGRRTDRRLDPGGRAVRLGMPLEPVGRTRPEARGLRPGPDGHSVAQVRDRWTYAYAE